MEGETESGTEREVREAEAVRVPVQGNDLAMSARRNDLAIDVRGNDLAIDVRGVTKTFGSRRKPVRALRGIDLQVPRGSIFGLLGPNGAGKSTLVKILMTVIRPTACRGTMLGRAVGNRATLARIGYLPEHHRFPDYLTAEQVLDHFGALSLVPRSVRRKRTPELLELVGIGDWAKVKVKGFSKGMRQRLGLANALVNDPDLVLLDEPTDGVDPVGRRDIRNFLFELRSRGKTIFLNSHLLSELEMLCDTVAILVQGSVSSQGTIDDLTRYSRRYEIEVGAAASIGIGGGGGTAVLATPGLATSGLATRAMIESALGSMLSTGVGAGAGMAEGAGDSAPPGSAMGLMLTATDGSLVPVKISDRDVQVATNDPSVIQPMLDALRGRGLLIRAVRPVRATLEDLFMLAVTDPTTGGTLRPGAAMENRP